MIDDTDDRRSGAPALLGPIERVLLQTTPENTYIHYNIHTNAKNPKACVRSHELWITQAQRIQELHERESSSEERAAEMRERQRSDDREDPIAKRDHPEETIAKRDERAIVKRRSRKDDRRDDREATKTDERENRRARRDEREETSTKRRRRGAEAKQAAEARR